MAYHQGMSFMALGNLLHGNLMHRRFLNDPRVVSTDLLLHERDSSAHGGQDAPADPKIRPGSLPTGRKDSTRALRVVRYPGARRPFPIQRPLFGDGLQQRRGIQSVPRIFCCRRCQGKRTRSKIIM